MVYFLASCAETLAPGISFVFYTSVLVTFLLLVGITSYKSHISEAHFSSGSPCCKLNLTACLWGKRMIL